MTKPLVLTQQGSMHRCVHVWMFDFEKRTTKNKGRENQPHIIHIHIHIHIRLVVCLRHEEEHACSGLNFFLSFFPANGRARESPVVEL